MFTRLSRCLPGILLCVCALAAQVNADVNAEQVIAHLKSVSSWAQQADDPQFRIVKYDATKTSPSHYSVTNNSRHYFVDLATGQITSVAAVQGKDGTYKSFITEDEAWSLRPDLPKNRLELFIDKPQFTEYALKLKDGSYDQFFAVGITRNDNGQITHVFYRNSPLGRSEQAPMISKERASAIATRYAKNYRRFNHSGSVSSYKHQMVQDIIGPMLAKDVTNDLRPVFYVSFCLSSAVDFKTPLASDETRYVSLNVTVDAVNGQVLAAHYDSMPAFNTSGVPISTPSEAPASALLPITVNDDHESLFQPCYRMKQTAIVPLKLMQHLAKPHDLTAKAGEKAFTLDGERFKLLERVVKRDGTLYLPWQALNSLPGVTAIFNAQTNKLEITTATEKTAE